MRSARLSAFAILLAVTGAFAKDKPPQRTDETRRATGCEYLGAGYVKMPGSDTCVKLSGSVRTEAATTFGK